MLQFLISPLIMSDAHPLRVNASLQGLGFVKFRAHLLISCLGDEGCRRGIGRHNAFYMSWSDFSASARLGRSLSEEPTSAMVVH